MTVDDAIAAFLADLEVGKSPKTLATYRTALQRFRAFLVETTAPPKPRSAKPPARGADAKPTARKDTAPRAGQEQPPPLALPLGELTIDQPIDFGRWLVRLDPAQPKSTLFTYTTAVSRFYAFLVREDLRPDLALPKLQTRLAALRGKRPRALPRVPADEAIAKIVETARSQPAGPNPAAERARLRNIALVESLRGSGMRVSEAAGLRRGDLVRETHSARVTGKGRKDRVVYFTDEAWRAIEAYLAARQDGATSRGLASQPVFARHDRAAGGRVLPLLTRGIWEVVGELAERAGLEELGITPHRFRAWFATHLVEQTGDLAAAQDLLGHESADTTRVYTKVASQRLREIHRIAFER